METKLGGLFHGNSKDVVIFVYTLMKVSSLISAIFLEINKRQTVVSEDEISRPSNSLKERGSQLDFVLICLLFVVRIVRWYWSLRYLIPGL